MKKNIFIHISTLFFCFAFVLLNHDALCQPQSAARYEIDAKRIDVSPTEKDALPRSREFLRLDSTYYVGWMYEGIYKFDHSADYLGYQNALIPLRKAFLLIDKDFGKIFYTLYDSPENLIQYISRYQDLYQIYDALLESYDNLEMPDSVMSLIEKISQYGFKKDYGFGMFYHRAWTYHRNRFFTSGKYPFLKNSVQENEQMAFEWCYRGLAFIQKNKEEDDALFGQGQSVAEYLAIYHYLALLHCYNKNYDSSEYYYKQLISGGAVSWNNYGGMQGEIGHFANAREYFSRDEDLSFMNGMLREAYYYVPELYVFAGRTKDAIAMGRQAITESASSPGFGWYAIGLARSFLYDGQLDSCALYLDKAANFKELHIGTTLTQTQYDFTIHLLQVQLYDRKIFLLKFQHKNWWYSPSVLYELASCQLQKFMVEYVVVNEMIFNPDRTRLIYDLFCAESTTSYDEAMYVMKDFSPKFFLDKYENYTTTDPRKEIQRYFSLFVASFQLQNKDYKDAVTHMENMENEILLDTANEKLFIGRLYENLYNGYHALDYKSEENGARAQLMNEYAPLIPFSGITAKIYLTTSGISDAVTSQVVKQLKSCNIDFVNSSATADGNADILFVKKGAVYQVNIHVISSKGKTIVENQTFLFKEAGNAGYEIARRLFGCGGSAVL
ncbi:MAG: hypothetical protein JSS67_09910 [Bacteroidetes bacterium]|nr:hypothetical protein [Bacteroidota bacterium]